MSALSTSSGSSDFVHLRLSSSSSTDADFYYSSEDLCSSSHHASQNQLPIFTNTPSILATLAAHHLNYMHASPSCSPKRQSAHGLETDSFSRTSTTEDMIDVSHRLPNNDMGASTPLRHCSIYQCHPARSDQEWDRAALCFAKSLLISEQKRLHADMHLYMSHVSAVDNIMSIIHQFATLRH